MNRFTKPLLSVQVALISVVAVAQDNETYATYYYRRALADCSLRVFRFALKTLDKCLQGRYLL